MKQAIEDLPQPSTVEEIGESIGVNGNILDDVIPENETEEEQANRLSKNIHRVFKEVRKATPEVVQKGAAQGTKAAVEVAKIMAESKQAAKEEVHELEARLKERLKEMEDEQAVQAVQPDVNGEVPVAEGEVVKEFTSGNLLPGQDEKDTESLQVDAADIPYMLQLTIEQRNDALTKLTATQATMVRLRNERKVIEDALAFKGVVMKELITEYFESLSSSKP